MSDIIFKSYKSIKQNKKLYFNWGYYMNTSQRVTSILYNEFPYLKIQPEDIGN